MSFYLSRGLLTTMSSQCLPGAAPAPPTSTSSAPTTSTAPATTSAGGTTTVSPPSGTAAPSGCSTPSTVSGFSNHMLPNPFLFNDGTPVQSKEDWECRSAQITALVQGYEGGALAPAPSSLTAKFTKSGNKGTLAITAANPGASITFSPTITFPSGNPPAAGWPLVIGYEGGSIPVPSNVSVFVNHISTMDLTHRGHLDCGNDILKFGYGSTKRRQQQSGRRAVL